MLTSYHFRHDKQVNGANTLCLSCNARPVQSERRRAGQYHFPCCNRSVLPTSSVYYIAGQGELDKELKLIVQGMFLKQLIVIAGNTVT